MTRDLSDVTHRKRGLRFEKSQLVEFCLGRRRLTFACRRRQAGGLAAGAARDGGGDGKASTERFCLSPYVEKPFNSKVIKIFIPELRSRQVFFVFRDSYVIYVRYEHPMYISHISNGYVTTVPIGNYCRDFFAEIFFCCNIEKIV